MAPYSFFGHLIGVTYSTCCAFDTLSILSVNLRFHWRQRTWHLGSWNEQRGGRVYVFSISPEERITSRGKVIFLCCHHEMVQRLRRGLPSSIWIRWYNCWSNENYFIVEVTCFFNTNLYIDFAALQKRKFRFFSTRYSRLYKARLWRHGVFGTWRQLMYTYMHNRGHKDSSLNLFTCFFDKFSIFSIYSRFEYIGRHGGLLVSPPVTGSSCPSWRPGRGHCVVFLGETIYS